MARTGAAGLTPKQAAFCEQYIVDLNGTQAAIRAGYTAKTASVQAARLLANAKIQAYIQQLKQQQQTRTQITADWVIQQLANIAGADGSAYTTVDANGAIKYTPTDQLSPAQRAAIAGIKPTMAGPEIKTYDRLRALELLGKHLGLFDRQADTGTDIEDLSPLADMLDDGGDGDD